MSLKMDKSNEDRLKILIGFIREDKAKDMGNIEKAAADFLENNFSLVIGIADAYDESSAN